MTERALAIDYHKIDLTQIRILILQHGISNDEVVCALVPVNHDGAEYHALSYEWGEASNDDPSITVNGHKVQIRRNLFDALRSIRKPTEDQKLWVDAICINQSDVDEKSEQVSMMGNTFSRAIGVIAWLGPANDDSDLAMDLMSDDKSLDASLPSLSKDSREGRALSALSFRTYWRRIWIIQELYLARTFVVWCGAKSIPRDTFEVSVGTLNRVASPFNGDETYLKSPANQLNFARRLRSGPGFNTLRRWLGICVSGDFQCSKKQDFVYALLDISADFEALKETFKVDYSKSPREVFLELLWWRDPSPSARQGTREQQRFLDIAKKMDLNVDEDLRGQISSRFPRRES
ncbi:heterokaryon incompatibility het-6 [Fusarium pseudocircinatum]|uniref:Heterokaryon incompatibility het-6 n=1 Tax=Fusarium pseudocircinatum TaxID=56676 RepID=A0A8H5NWT9_9HYPO|nr:heterokaryon incompatibility het-6 [Fusarium pseudocircinatum]